MFQPPLLSTDLIDGGGKRSSPETKLKDLERSNLDLKLRLDASHRTTQKTIELETERLLRNKVGTEKKGYPSSSSYSPSSLSFPPSIPRSFVSSSSSSIKTPFQRNVENDVQLESNLRSERQAAMALAEHDSKIIESLEADVANLKNKRESEQRLNAELVEKVSVLMKTLEGKERDIKSYQESCKNKENLIDVLEGRIKKQDEVLTSLLKQRLSPGKWGSATSVNDMNSSMTSASGGKQLTFSPQADDQSQLGMNKMKPIKYVPSAENQNFFSPLGTPAALNGNEGSQNFSKEWSDMVNLRTQLSQLNDQLDREQRLRRNQDNAMDNLRTSAEEITLLEAEEIARLQDEKDIWQQEKAKLVEEKEFLSEILGEYEARLKEYESIMKNENIDPNRPHNPSQDNMNTSLQSVAASKFKRQNDEDMPKLGEPFFNSRVRHAVNSPKRNKSGQKRGSSVDYEDSSNSSRSMGIANNHDDDGDNEKYISRPYSPAHMQIPHTIELYRVRESELLDALEGVVNRVAELEGALHEKDIQTLELQERLSMCKCNAATIIDVDEDNHVPQNTDLPSKSSSIVADVRAAMSTALHSPDYVSSTTSQPELSEVMNNTRSTNIAAEARLAMSNILNSPDPHTVTPKPASPMIESKEGTSPPSSESPKFPVGSRVTFLWTNALQSTPIPWPGTVQCWNTSLRCNIPKNSNIGDMVEIHLGNGNSEQVEFVPGSTFKIFGNRLQFPANTQAGKSVVWNNIKGNIGVRWYDIVLDKTDKVTRAYEHELRHIQEGDVVPNKNKLLVKARKSGVLSLESDTGSSNIGTTEVVEGGTASSRRDGAVNESSPLQHFINMFSPNRPEI